MRYKLQRVLCLALCVVMAFSCAVVPAGAIVIAPAIVTVAKFVGINIAAWLVGKGTELALQKLKDFADGKSNDTDGLITSISALDSSATRIKVTHDYLLQLAYDWNRECSAAVGFTCDVIEHRMSNGQIYGVIVARINRGIATTYLADGTGRILCCDLTEETSGRWIPVAEAVSTRYLLSYMDLYNLANSVGGMLRLKDSFYEIYNRRGEIYCNVSGYRFSSIYEKNSSAVNQDRPLSSGSGVDNGVTNNYISQKFVEQGDTIYIKEGDTYHSTNYDITNIEEGDSWYIKEGDTYYEIVIDNSQHIDIENMTQVLPGGVLNEIDNLIYNPDTKTYYIDSHDTTNYNTSFYLYQYHINYTSITYIGQTEEYDKKYELYYQLPDGRDSADLTVEDLEQLSTSFKDVVNYARSADDLSQRVLYHFDGNTQDSSYWSYISSLDWAKGASLTYMDEGTFGGSLYLDETEHDFTITLPSNDASGDWTLQWRYYQSHTEAPVKDSFVLVAGTKVLQFDGVKYYTGSGAVIAATSVGSWNELCLMRKGGVVYYYINGVYYTSAAASTIGSTVRFVFGAEQQTYKKLDELRFTRGSLYSAGANYMPTSVPYDSNLTLVLPDGKIPLADEVATFKPGTNNLFSSTGLVDWSDPGVIPNVKTAPSDSSVAPPYTIQRVFDLNVLYRNPSYTTLTSSGGSTSFRVLSTTFGSWAGSVYKAMSNGLFLPVCSHEDVIDEETGWISEGSTSSFYPLRSVFTLSFVLVDGSYSSITFKVESGHLVVISSDISSLLMLSSDFLLFTSGDETATCQSYLEGIKIMPSSSSNSCSIVYAELVQGSSHEWAFSYEGAVYDPGELTESPVLAVRSNTPISSSQIGGVRPSYPKKGQLYAMVENGYIVSLQQYTGSAWEAVDGRIWTGSRWIPASSYNVITLQDMYDIVDATTDYEYIYTETGFWSWLQKAWKDLISRLDLIVNGLSLGSGNGCQHVYNSEVDDDATCTEPGHKIYTCNLCGHVYTELIDPLGHDWVVTGTVGTKPDPEPEPGDSNPYLAIIRNPVSEPKHLGEIVNFSVEAVGSQLTYQWEYSYDGISFQPTSAPGCLTPTLSPEVVVERHGVHYRCVVTDLYGNSIISDVVTLIAIELQETIFIQTHPQSVSVPEGTIVSFSVVAYGSDLIYQWEYFSDSNGVWRNTTVPGCTTSTITMPATRERDGIVYRCRVSDSSGNSVYSSGAVLSLSSSTTFSLRSPASVRSVEYYEILTCSRCGLTTKDYGDGPEELDSDIFDALGDFVAEGITWILDKATELVDSLNGIIEVFNRFVDRIRSLIGVFPAFLAAVLVFFPEDLMVVIWFGVIAFVVRAVWKKYNKS